MKAKIIKLQKFYQIPKVDARIAVTPRTTYDIFYSFVVGPSIMKLLRSLFPMDVDKFESVCELWKRECVSSFGYKPRFYFSETAKSNGIDNFPYTDFVQYNLLASNRLLAGLLYLLKDKFDVDCSFISCTSAYRCDAVNKLVGGSLTSMHKRGLAYDLVFSSSEDVDKFIDIVIDYCSSDDVIFCDKPTLMPFEIIKYTSGNRVHIGFKYLILCDFELSKND